jgi:hypothetical protein
VKENAMKKKDEKPRSFEEYWEQALQRGTPEWIEREYRAKTRQPLEQTIKKLLQTPPAPKKQEDSD